MVNPAPTKSSHPIDHTETYNQTDRHYNLNTVQPTHKMEGVLSSRAQFRVFTWFGFARLRPRPRHGKGEKLAAAMT